jgi:hypothetical protein
MGAYKKINKQDNYTTTYIAHKTWTIPGSSLAAYGIETFTATGSYLTSLQQLYYPTKQLGEIVSHSFDYHPQTTLHFSQSRNLTTGSYIISIPKSLYGTNINPGASVQSGSVGPIQSNPYVLANYWINRYTDDPVTVTFGDGVSILDDGEGNLYQSGSVPRRYIGDIIYPHGMLIITDQQLVQNITGTGISNLQFQSSVPIYTYNIHCRLRDSEFNYTYNPSVLKESYLQTYYNGGDLYTSSSRVNNGELKDNITGSVFSPYITTIGLYNEANQLIAVGKVGQPIPKSTDTDMTFIIKLDI